MKNLRESLLTNTKVKVQSSLETIKKIVKVPKVKDFKKTTNRFHQYVVWECPHILEQYKKKYPDFVNKDYTELIFVIDSSRRVVVMEIYMGLPERREFDPITGNMVVLSPNTNTDESTNGHARRQLVGWLTQFFDGGVRTAKAETIKIIEELAEDSSKIDKIFEHSAKHFNEYKSKGWLNVNNYKSLIYDLC